MDVTKECVNQWHRSRSWFCPNHFSVEVIVFINNNYYSLVTIDIYYQVGVFYKCVDQALLHHMVMRLAIMLRLGVSRTSDNMFTSSFLDDENASCTCTYMLLLITTTSKGK